MCVSSTPRQHFEVRAVALEDCATLTTESIEGVGDSLTIMPHNSDSLAVYLIDFGNHQFQVGFDHDYHVPDEDAQTPDDVDAFLLPAVEGRVRMLIGPRRAQIQVLSGSEFENFGVNSHGLRSLIPAPGWRRRAQVLHFPAYRSPTAN